MALRFVGKLILFCAIVFGLCAAIYMAIPPNKKAYLAALDLKHNRLDSLTESADPKLVLVGGSNVAFGLHSGMLEDSFGMPTVNMAIHAGLRYEYMINQLRESVRSGDVYLIFPEFSQMYEPLSDGGPIIYQSLEVYPEGIKYCHDAGALGNFRFFWNSKVEILQLKVRRTMGKMVGMTEKNAYKASVFDRYGDIWSPMTLESKYNKRDKHMDRNRGKDPSADFVRLTNEFAAQAKEAGARVIFVFPAIAEAKWDAEVAEATRVFLKDKLEIPIANNPADYVYKNELFFDTKYHTTQQGRAIRTAQTIEDLARFFPNR